LTNSAERDCKLAFSKPRGDLYVLFIQSVTQYSVLSPRLAHPRAQLTAAPRTLMVSLVDRSYRG